MNGQLATMDVHTGSRYGQRYNVLFLSILGCWIAADAQVNGKTKSLGIEDKNTRTK
jgi:hypothetical protein